MLFVKFNSTIEPTQFFVSFYNILSLICIIHSAAYLREEVVIRFDLFFAWVMFYNREIINTPFLLL